MSTTQPQSPRKQLIAKLVSQLSTIKSLFSLACLPAEVQAMLPLSLANNLWAIDQCYQEMQADPSCDLLERQDVEEILAGSDLAWGRQMAIMHPCPHNPEEKACQSATSIMHPPSISSLTCLGSLSHICPQQTTKNPSWGSLTSILDLSNQQKYHQQANGIQSSCPQKNHMPSIYDLGQIEEK